ncbi:hypothetical protein [Phaeodactylibacter sp.]|nr:hypothetical protein [Phaeodactylibacter sp.]MCI5093020.1 hypothetical protein [Phaeodactylibacter sp.]
MEQNQELFTKLMDDDRMAGIVKEMLLDRVFERLGGEIKIVIHFIQMKLSKSHTGIASEFFVAAELSRRGYNVTLTLGNTKSIDLLVEKESNVVPIQVKGIQRTKSICWSLKSTSLREDIIYVFVNLNADTLSLPEFFVLNYEEVKAHLKTVASGRNYIDYNYLKRLDFEDGWDRI